MPSHIQIHPSDLRLDPALLTFTDTPKHLALGDLHGNALKFCYQLMQTGILTFSDPFAYLTIKRIYHTKVQDLAPEDLDRFKKMLWDAAVNPKVSLTLIGDDLADRGEWDLLTLLIIERLAKGGIDLEILLSNHGAEFLIAFELGERYDPGIIMHLETKSSLLHTRQWLSLHPSWAVHFSNLVQNVYIPCIKAISTTYDEKEKKLSVFTHAPVGLNTIQALALKLDLPYGDSNEHSLITTIDEINQKLSTCLKEKRLNVWFYQEFYSLDHLNEKPEFCLSKTHATPLFQLLWNRDELPIEVCQPESSNYQLQFYHGHIGKEQAHSPHHTNLDFGFLGKGRELLLGESVIHTSDEDTRLQQKSHILASKLPDEFDPASMTPYFKYYLFTLMQRFPQWNDPDLRSVVKALQHYPIQPWIGAPFPLLPEEQESLLSFIERMKAEGKAIRECESFKDTLDEVLELVNNEDPNPDISKAYQAKAILNAQTSFQAKQAEISLLLSGEMTVFLQRLEQACKRYNDEQHQQHCFKQLQGFLTSLEPFLKCTGVEYFDDLMAVKPLIQAPVSLTSYAELNQQLPLKTAWPDFFALYRLLRKDEEAYQSIQKLLSLEESLKCLQRDETLRTLFNAYFSRTRQLFEKLSTALRENKASLKAKQGTFEQAINTSIKQKIALLEREKLVLEAVQSYAQAYQGLKKLIQNESRIQFKALQYFSMPAQFNEPLTFERCFILNVKKLPAYASHKLESIKEIQVLMMGELEAMQALLACLKELDALEQLLHENRLKRPKKLEPTVLKLHDLTTLPSTTALPSGVCAQLSESGSMTQLTCSLIVQRSEAVLLLQLFKALNLTPEQLTTSNADAGAQPAIKALSRAYWTGEPYITSLTTYASTLGWALPLPLETFLASHIKALRRAKPLQSCLTLIHGIKAEQSRFHLGLPEPYQTLLEQSQRCLESAPIQIDALEETIKLLLSQVTKKSDKRDTIEVFKDFLSQELEAIKKLNALIIWSASMPAIFVAFDYEPAATKAFFKLLHAYKKQIMQPEVAPLKQRLETVINISPQTLLPGVEIPFPTAIGFQFFKQQSPLNQTESTPQP